MKTKQTTQLIRFVGTILLGVLTPATLGQGTINFNEPWIYSGQVIYENYYEQGFWFRREMITPSGFPYDPVRRTSGEGGVQSDSPFLIHSATRTVPDTLAFSRVDGRSFGLISIDVAGPDQYLGQPESITFNGIRPDGSSISTVFDASGVTSFQTFYFDSSFASGLARMEIPSTRWALDNIVFVPEPDVASLLGLGALALVIWRWRGKKTVKP